jgi:hypothetical protein
MTDRAKPHAPLMVALLVALAAATGMLVAGLGFAVAAMAYTCAGVVTLVALEAVSDGLQPQPQPERAARHPGQQRHG